MVKFILSFLFVFSSFSTDISVKSLFEAQTKSYKSKDWSKVFAIGHLYRNRFLRTEDEVKAAFSPNLFKLEIFALAEKCQWKKAKVLIDLFETYEKQKFSSKVETTKLKAKIENFKAYKFVTKESSPNKLNDNKDSIIVESIDWSNVSDVEDIRIHVEGLCQK